MFDVFKLKVLNLKNSRCIFAAGVDVKLNSVAKQTGFRTCKNVFKTFKTDVCIQVDKTNT